MMNRSDRGERGGRTGSGQRRPDQGRRTGDRRPATGDRRRRLILGLAFGLGMLGGYEGRATAEGCYICASGSSPQCRDYCRYSGADTFDARKTCEKLGCKIGGTSSCPTAANYVICHAGAARSTAPEPPGPAQRALDQRR